MADRETTKATRLGDQTVRKVMEEVFTAEYRHGYFLKEIVRSQEGDWLLIWQRTIDSYARDFDWATPAPYRRGLSNG